MPAILDSEALALAETMGITSQDVARRLRYVDFREEDAVKVATLAPEILPYTGELSAVFFDYLKNLPEAAPLFEKPELVAEALRLKEAHLRAMLTGPHDKAYAGERLKLGMLYSRAGLDPRVFLGAFHHLMRAVGFKAMERLKVDALRSFDAFMSFKKLAFFDLSLIVDVIVFERERIIREQQQAIRELSCPVLKIRDRVLVMPLVGAMDAERSRLVTESLLEAVRGHRARAVVIDVSGVPGVDSAVAEQLVQAVASARLMGAAVVVTGLSSEVSRALVTLGADLSSLSMAADVERGLEAAEGLAEG
jgi:rsbT co-antagonist protein RsbR